MVRDGTDEGIRRIGASSPVAVTDFAPDGSAFIARWRTEPKGADVHCRYTLPTMSAIPVTRPQVPRASIIHQPVRTWPLRYQRFVRSGNLRRALRQIGVMFGSLVVVVRKGRCLRLFMDRAQQRFQLIDVPFAGVAPHLLQPFSFTRPPEGVGYRMRMAQWADGSRAFVDSRGLLHLQSSDPAIPEATLVLDDGHVSGWSADGRMWGAKFYIGRHAPTPAEEIDATIIEPFIRRLR
jgi:hypothetical protein